MPKKWHKHFACWDCPDFDKERTSYCYKIRQVYNNCGEWTLYRMLRDNELTNGCQTTRYLVDNANGLFFFPDLDDTITRQLNTATA